MEADLAKKWMAQWRAAAGALEEFRAEELSRLDENKNAAIAATFFPHGEFPIAPSLTSGLVEQQRIFLKARKR
jgi:hypothetical protein